MSAPAASRPALTCASVSALHFDGGSLPRPGRARALRPPPPPHWVWPRATAARWLSLISTMPTTARGDGCTPPPQRHGVFLEAHATPAWSCACRECCGTRSLHLASTNRAVSVATPAQPLHKIQRHPLGRQQAACMPRKEEDRVAARHPRPVLGIDAYRHLVIELMERLDRQREPGDHAGFARHKSGARAPVAENRGNGGDVVEGAVFLEGAAHQGRDLRLVQRKAQQRPPIDAWRIQRRDTAWRRHGVFVHRHRVLPRCRFLVLPMAPRWPRRQTAAPLVRSGYSPNIPGGA
jgi:hypothetical protein